MPSFEHVTRLSPIICFGTAARSLWPLDNTTSTVSAVVKTTAASSCVMPKDSAVEAENYSEDIADLAFFAREDFFALVDFFLGVLLAFFVFLDFFVLLFFVFFVDFFLISGCWNGGG